MVYVGRPTLSDSERSYASRSRRLRVTLFAWPAGVLSVAAALMAPIGPTGLSPTGPLPYAVIKPSDQFGLRPPVEFMHDTTIKVQFHSDDVDLVCEAEGVPHPSTGTLVGCAGYGDATHPPTIHMPNPCFFQEPYAQVLCHEMAHTNGYTHPVQ